MGSILDLREWESPDLLVEERYQYRMYCMVMYNISTIQKGVQAAHCCLEYAYNYHTDKRFKQYVQEDKTMIILDGGTSHDMLDIRNTLIENGIQHACFIEPDLNDAMSSICFLADERVWDRKKYLPYNEWKIQNGIITNLLLSDPPEETHDSKTYKRWVEYMGGDKNVFLRELIQYKPLAR